MAGNGPAQQQNWTKIRCTDPGRPNVRLQSLTLDKDDSPWKRQRVVYLRVAQDKSVDSDFRTRRRTGDALPDWTPEARHSAVPRRHRPKLLVSKSTPTSRTSGSAGLNVTAQLWPAAKRNSDGKKNDSLISEQPTVVRACPPSSHICR